MFDNLRYLHLGPSPGLTSPGPTSPSSRPDHLVSPASRHPTPLPEVPENPQGVPLEGGELPAVPPTRDQWVPDDKVSNCMVCQDRLSMVSE